MKISIVTISFNQGDYVRHCIDSVLSQSYGNFEYIIVDAGSMDNSRAVINLYDDQRIIKVFEKDQGPADGLNKGFGKATGEIFGFLNADDILLPGAFEKVVRAFTVTPKIDVLTGHGYVIDEKGKVIRQIFSTKYSLKRYFYGAANIVQQSTFFRREVFCKVGGFNVHNNWFWDGELFARISKAGGVFSKIPEFLACFRIHDQSITGGKGDYAGYISSKEMLRIELLGKESKPNKLVVLLYRILKSIENPTQAIYSISKKGSSGSHGVQL